MTATADVVAGRYELGAVLGRGGMGDVRAARDLRLGRAVAVKLMPPGLARDPVARTRFEDEARAAARIVHPHVVAVYDSGEHDGTPFLVMECLPGRTLADEIAAGPVPPARVRDLALEVLAGLEAAHRAGVLHRDLKPGNILLTADGHAKVGDFGIAKMAEGLDHTATGVVVGTPSYLAPERREGLPATPRSDLYAVGVVVHEALTGAKPPRPTPLDGDATRRDLAPLGAPPPGSAALAWAAWRAMAADPDERFASAGEMAAAIAGPMAPVASREATVPEAATADTTVAGGTGPAAREADGGAAGTTLPGRPATRRPERHRRWVLPALATVVVVLVALLALAGARDDGARDDGAGGGAPGSPALPEDLERRVRALEDAVRP